MGGSSIFSEETKQLWGCGHGFSMIGSFGFILVALVFLLWHTFPAEYSSHCRWSGPLPRPAVMSSDNFDFQRIWSECPAASTGQMPWEKPFWKSFFEGSVLPQPREWKASIPPAFVQCALDVEPQPAKKAKTVPPVSWHHVVKSSADVSWQDKREADFQVSLRRWLDLLLRVSKFHYSGLATRTVQFHDRATAHAKGHPWQEEPCNNAEKGQFFPSFCALFGNKCHHFSRI